MLKHNKFPVLSLAVLLALAFAAVMPLSAFAQDEVPPLEVPAEVVEEVPPVEEVIPAVEEVIPAAEEVVPVAEESLTVPEILDAAPEGTEVVVLDEGGEALPLASAEAAETIQTSDPMWCPSSATTVTADCVYDNELGAPGDGKLLDKIYDKIIALGSTAGTIYFTSSYTANDVYFTSSKAFNFKDSALTLQGGWDGNTALNSTITYSGSTVFSVPVTVNNWQADVIINDVTVSGVGAISSVGLFVKTTGDVVLDHVNSSSNTFITPDEGIGAYIYTPGDVSVSNSHFDSNKGDQNGAHGLYISSDGNVKLENVSANQNTDANGSGYGIEISNYSSGTTSVTLTNVQANGTGTGASIQSLGDVTVTDSLFNLNDNSFGLNIAADGNVTLNNVTASDNKGSGVNIYGYSGDHPASVTIQNSFFNGNTANGIYLGYGGPSSVKCSQINNNDIGIWADGVGALTNDSNTFSGNGKGVSLINGATEIIKSSGGCVEVISGGNQPVGVNQPAGAAGEGGARGFVPQNNLFPQGALVEAQIITVPTDLPLADLPASLPAGKTFAAGADIKLALNGEEVESAPQGAQAFFEIPAGMNPPFVVLFWNGSEWVDVPSQVVGGKVVFSVTNPGTYVLTGQ